jgi:hypothetical protein
MDNLNFVNGGNTGDLIHQLYAIKNICIRDNAMANIYLVDETYKIPGCGNFLFNLSKTIEDTKDFILAQDFVNSYEILPKPFDKEYHNLNMWRFKSENKSWTDLMSSYYNFDIPETYKWLDNIEINDEFKDKIIIHNSVVRHNPQFNWEGIIDGISNDILFITSNDTEYGKFNFKNDKIKLFKASTVSEMVIAINSCKLFIGNQSLPFAIASALDVPRICELHESSKYFYMGEHVYSDNISWFFNNTTKHNSENIKIEL